MDSLTLQLDQLRNPNKNRRYDACEQLRIAPRLPQEAIAALEQTTLDPDPDVSDAARRALLAHKQDEIYSIAEMQIPKLPLALGERLVPDYTAMLKEIRSWGIWSLGLGVMHILASGFFSAPWGILLIIVGLTSFTFRTASMFIVYAVTLTWAAVSNLISGSSGWLFFALLQLYLAVGVFRRFRQFRKVEAELGNLSGEEASQVNSDRSKRFFPLLGSLLSCSTIAGLVALFAAALILGMARATLPQFLGFLADLMMNLAVLGFGISLASLLSGYRPKILAVTGLIAGILMMALNLGLRLLWRAG